MVHRVAVEDQRPVLLQNLQHGRLAGACSAGDPDDDGIIRRLNAAEPRRLFQSVGHGKSKSPGIGTLGKNFRHTGAVKGAQRVKHSLRLRLLIVHPAEPVNDVSGEKTGKLVKNDDARARASPVTTVTGARGA